MKKFLLCICLVLTAVSSYAQEHMTFKNIPITGDLSSFISKMKSSGFSLVDTKENAAIMEGSFAGFEDCSILVAYTRKTKTVWKVVVLLPSQQSWSSVRSRYNDFKESYTEKYGAPTHSFAFFSDPYELGDGYELQAIHLDKGTYASYWDREDGIIVVEIDASSNSYGYIKLTYEDKLGGLVLDKEMSEIINDDI